MNFNKCIIILSISMGCWDEFCIICAGPIRSSDLIESTRHKWLNKLILINENNEAIKSSGNTYDEYGCLVGDGGIYCVTPHIAPDDENDPAIVCHQDCFEVLQQELGYVLNYDDVIDLLKDQCTCTINPSIHSYGEMNDYIEQAFDYIKCIEKHPWMLKSPLKNRQNLERIINLWTEVITEK